MEKYREEEKTRQFTISKPALRAFLKESHTQRRKSFSSKSTRKNKSQERKYSIKEQLEEIYQFQHSKTVSSYASRGEKKEEKIIQTIKATNEIIDISKHLPILILNINDPNSFSTETHIS